MPIARSALWVIAVLSLLTLAPMAALLSVGLADTNQSTFGFWQSRYIHRALGFSLWQAFLSTLISIIFALIVTRILAFSGAFRGRELILKLFALPLVIPSIVAVMAIVSVYGSEGVLSLGRSLYGINGILLAHVFFNMPLAVRLLLPVWQSIPSQYFCLAEQMSFNGWQKFRHIEWPVLRENLPGVCLIVFMLCLTSFAVVLTLGGGPKSTTLEVAIYQSLRFEFEPAQAVTLALLQLIICLVVAAIMQFFQQLPDVEIVADSLSGVSQQFGLLAKIMLSLALLFVGLPLLSVINDALSGPLSQSLTDKKLWESAMLSLCIGLSSAFLAVTAGWLLLRSSSDYAFYGKSGKAKWIEMAGSIVYVIPPLVIGTGYFILLSPHVNVFDWALPIVILVNAMMGLPFVIRSLGPAMRQNQKRYLHLCQSLQLKGWNRWKFLDWPMLRRPLALSAGLVCALAMGDLGVIALFGTPETTTLPLYLYQQLGAYRVTEAAVTAVFLLSFCLMVYWTLERIIGGKESA